MKRVKLSSATLYECTISIQKTEKFSFYFGSVHLIAQTLNISLFLKKSIQTAAVNVNEPRRLCAAAVLFTADSGRCVWLAQFE